MGWYWNPIGILGVVSATVGFALAGLVYRAGPRLAANRTLALLLFMEAIVQAACAGGLGNFLDDPAAVFGLAGVNQTAFMAMPFLYLLFLGAALDTPLVRPFRRRWGRAVLVVCLFATEAFWLTNTESFVSGVRNPWYGRWASVPGDGSLLFGRLYAVVSLFAMAAAFDAYRRARAPAARTRAKFSALAFAARDVFWLVLVLYVVPYTKPGLERTWGLFWTQGMPGFMLVFVLLLGYGLLRHQLFDIDLRLKRGAARGVAVAAVPAMFFVVSESAERLSPFEGWIPGLLAAAALALLFMPLQRRTERLLDRWMPASRDTPEYRARRKADVYRAALEELSRGGISAREREALATLQSRLGIGAAEAITMEREVNAAAV